MKKIFLGGTRNNSSWRKKVMPMLDAIGVDYFNPVVEDWTPECQTQEIKERASCDICLYVITPEMLDVYSIAEAVEDSVKRPTKTIFVVLEEYGSITFDTVQLKSLYAVGELIEVNYAAFFTDLETVVETIRDEYI